MTMDPFFEQEVLGSVTEMNPVNQFVAVLYSGPWRLTFTRDLCLVHGANRSATRPESHQVCTHPAQTVCVAPGTQKNPTNCLKPQCDR